MSLIKKRNTTTLTEGNTFFETIFEICTYLLLTGYFLFYDTRVLQIAFVCVGLGGTALLTFSKAYSSMIKLPLNTIWYSLFFILAELSALWAHSPDNAINRYMRPMIILIIIGFGITQYVSTIKDVERLFKIFNYFVLTVSIIQMVFTPVNEWTEGFFGSAVGGQNANGFGYVACFASTISFFFGYVKRVRSYYVYTLIFLLCCILTSSRKAVAISIFSIILVVLLSFNKKNHILHFAIVVGAAFLVISLIFIDDVLYQLVGYRFDSLIGFWTTGSTQSESSVILREYFIQFARILFEEKPLIGHGFANFSIMLSEESALGIEVYAHNNYWEILADLGVIGFVIYYWFYTYLFAKLLTKWYKEKNNPFNMLAIVILICQVMLEWGVVSMASFYPQIVMSLIYVCSYASNSKRKFHYSPGNNVR